MSNLIVVTSTAADGSMLDRSDFSSTEVVNNREAFLKKHSMALDQTTRLNVMYDRDDYSRYHVVTSDEKGAGMRSNDVVIADALITTDVEHALMLPVADCVATVLYDPAHRVLMLTHLGRHSLLEDGGKKICSVFTGTLFE